MLFYVILLGGLGVLSLASASALREALRQKARLRGILLTLAMLLGSLLGIVALLI